MAEGASLKDQFESIESRLSGLQSEVRQLRAEGAAVQKFKTDLLEKVEDLERQVSIVVNWAQSEAMKLSGQMRAELARQKLAEELDSKVRGRGKSGVATTQPSIPKLDPDGKDE